MGFSMNVLDATEIEKEVTEIIKPTNAEEEKLRELAKNNAAEIINCNFDSLEEKRQILMSIEEFGMGTVQQSSRKNSLLQVPLNNLSKSGDEGSLVSTSLAELQREIKDLDPSLIDFTKTGFLGKIFNPIRTYFDKYQKADVVINNIILSLDKGRETLKNDNTTLDIEEHALRDLTKKLSKEIEMGTMMDEYIEQMLEEARINNADEQKIKFISEEILYPLRQRLMDMQQMIIVNQQGIMAMEIIKRNNKELIRGVDRAKNVTISALKTAVTVASALYNQKIVLKKIQALNETTDSIISSTSKMLKEQGADIQRQSMETSISIETLKSSFDDVMEALESISTYKKEALPQMKNTILQFKELSEKGEEEIKRLEKRTAFS